MDIDRTGSAASSDRMTDLGLSKAVADGDSTIQDSADDGDSTDANGTSRSRSEGVFVGDQNGMPAPIPRPHAQLSSFPRR